MAQSRRILVGIKKVLDYNARPQVRPDGSGIASEGVKTSVNPFDEIALEEALRLRDKGVADEVVALTIGPADCVSQLRTALAMGANRAIHVSCVRPLDSLVVARTILKIVQREQPVLVLLGKQAVDDDNAQAGPMVAALWGRGQATFASAIEVSGERIRVTREIDSGQQVIELDLPAVVTADLRLNEPRYVKLPDIMRAKRQPIETVEFDELGIDSVQHQKATGYCVPPRRAAGVRVKDASELVSILKQRGLV
jgi:electron transfer flavoprotein beta subunit